TSVSTSQAGKSRPRARSTSCRPEENPMSHSTTAPASTEAPENRPLAVPHPWRVAITVAVIMVLLALLGVGMTTARSVAAQLYWISMVPVFGVMCIVTAYLSADRGHFGASQIFRQLFHWLGIGIAVGLDFFLLRSGEQSGMGAGLVALLLLAV